MDSALQVDYTMQLDMIIDLLQQLDMIIDLLQQLCSIFMLSLVIGLSVFIVLFLYNVLKKFI